MFSWVTRVIKFFRVWGKLLLVVGPAVAAFLWSPFFKTFFLGVAVGASVMFGVQYAEIFGATPTECFNPRIDPNGPSCQVWVSTDSERGFGFWKPCDGLQ